MSRNRKKAFNASMFASIFGQAIAPVEPSYLENGTEKMSAAGALSLEHALLGRVLLAVENLLKNMEVSTDLSPVCAATELIGRVIEQHHMKFEEENIYPLFDKGKLADTVETLRLQHREARKTNGRICDLTSTGNVRDRAETDRLRRLFDSYRTLLSAHAAWEDTIVFPALLGTGSDDELNELKKLHKIQERNMLGKDAMKRLYEQLSELERSCGITSARDFLRPA